MISLLQEHIRQFLPVSDPELDGISSFFTTIVLAKKQNLLTEGKICAANYFVLKGCLRMYFVNEKGLEQTTQFALEHWWLSDYASFATQQPSEFYIQAVEPAEVLALTLTAQEALLKAHPVLERYFRLIHQRAHAAAQFRIRTLYEQSGQMRYHYFSQRFPEFVQRIPQYLLASYLHITPEYLSEIRARRIS